MVPYTWEQPPAITVVAWRSNKEKGWKGDYYSENLIQSCNIVQNFTMLVECIDMNTFNLSDILDQVNNGDELKQDITNNLSWSEDLGNFNLGKSYTLNNSYQLGIDHTGLEIYFKKGLNYTIWIHDPDYYMYALNPDTVPKESLQNKTHMGGREINVWCLQSQTQLWLKVLVKAMQCKGFIVLK